MSAPPPSLTVTPVVIAEEVRPGDDLAGLIAVHADLADGDVLVVAQKAVSKAEGALVAVPAGEEPAAARRRLALQQARRVVVDAPEVAIVETRHGFVCANAGIDASNVATGTLVLLPEDPDASARALRAALAQRCGATVAVIVSDTFGRPWRLGQTDVAIGTAGIAPLRDERGEADRHGHLLEVTEAAIADELAGAADLVRRKADGALAVVVRGLCYAVEEASGAGALVRPPEQDLFRRGRGALTDALTDALGGTDALARTDAGGALPLGAAALDRALAAGRRVGGAAVELQVLDGGRRVAVAPVPVPNGGQQAATSTEQAVRAGAAAMALVAAVLDLGGHATLRQPTSDEPGLVLVDVRAAPRPSDAAEPRAGEAR